MITIFNSKTIYLGTDNIIFNDIRNLLDTNHIKYHYKVKNQMGQWNGRGTVRGQTGSIGNPSATMYEYEIRVKKEDYGRAEQFCQQR